MADKLLRVEDLSISFSGIKAVQHLNFELEQGEFVALIGPTVPANPPPST